MRRLTNLQLRLRSVVSRGTVESELDEELRYHIERQIDENVARGMAPEDARCAAAREFGGYQQVKEECRDTRGWNLMESLIQDVIFAIRQLRKNPLFSGTAIFMLALGICASTAIFVFVQAALLKPLPYKDPARLLGVYEVVGQCPHCPLSWLDYVDWKKNNTTLSSLDVYQHTGLTLSTPSGPMPSRASRVSEGFFRTLGVTPILGRGFAPGEDRDGAERTVVLSYATWQGRYGGRKDILSQIVVLDAAPYRVIGVLPADFHFIPSEPSEYWVTVQPSAQCESRRSCHSLEGVGRLKDGVSLAAALANLKLVAKQLEVQYPGSNRDQGAIALPLSEVIVGDIRPILLVVLGGAVLLLMIATINVSSLLLVRSEARRREISVRAALGAGRGRLIRQFLVEGLVLVALASALGLAGASQLIRLLTLLIPAEFLSHIPVFEHLRLNFMTIAFAAAIGLLAALFFSVAPFFRISLNGLASGMAEGGRGSAGLTWRNMGSKLVVLELATAVVLLVSAGLLGEKSGAAAPGQHRHAAGSSCHAPAGRAG